MTLDLLGTIAAVLTTLSFMPQLIKIWRTRSAADISYAMYALFILGLVLWLAYGAAIGSVPMVLANGAVLAQALAVIVMKWRLESRS
ncbi:SemiSWEET family sugar transporter [Pigmentiphaga sp. D-2]|uniref:SemiSWEET family sugar transporter n=1 Tax=Pigmentiphaga sp. D-2 TaxID=1002116 RepID=UPI0010443965|nr:SemiSWEET transporter [Pigmentiphaga sp. D-2]